MDIPAVRGVILEEIVLYLLARLGYRIVLPSEEGTQLGHSGLEVQGRGEWHQIDALGAFDHTPAFIYPIRLMVEAKCYAARRPVGIDVVRNAVGVLKDVSENFFSDRLASAHNGSGISSLQYRRFNYSAAIFSTSGFTANAERYAIAHQVFLIQYAHNRLFTNISAGLMGLKATHFKKAIWRNSPNALARIRADIRNTFARIGVDETLPWGKDLLPNGRSYLEEMIVSPLANIGGSYFGMLQGVWPIHLLSHTELPAQAFARTDVVNCKVYGLQSDSWSFAPVNSQEGDPNWFRLEFDLPESVLQLVRKHRGDKLKIAGIKEQHFSFINIAGTIGGIRRQVRLQLSDEWIQDVIARERRRRGSDTDVS